MKLYKTFDGFVFLSTINKIMECINGVPLPVASVFDIPISELKQIL